MTRKTRMGHWHVVAVIAATLGLGACERKAGGGNSETNWLSSCRRSTECEVGSCLCGICTVPCTSSAQCGEVSSTAQCLDSGAFAECGSDVIGAVCAEAGTFESLTPEGSGGTGGNAPANSGGTGGSLEDGNGGNGMDGSMPLPRGSVFDSVGGAASASEIGGASVGGSPVDSFGGESALGEGGSSGRSNSGEFGWLENQGTQCESSMAQSTPLAADASKDCALLEINLPGVIEYDIDPSDFDLNREGAGGHYEYVGCDDVDETCLGRLEYTWRVEYLADNEWYVEISPVHDGCDYDHVMLHLLPTEDLSPRATLTWTQKKLRIHLQPTENGLTVGAVRSEDDQLLQPDAFTEIAYNGGWPEDEIRSLFNEAFVEHLKGLEWVCSHP